MDGIVGVEQWQLPPDATAPAHARRLLEGALSAWSDPSDAVLIASELVANMVRHGEDPFTLGAAVVDTCRAGRQVRLTATNVSRSPTASPHVVQAEAGALNGRGLAMVAALSEEWGWTQTDGLTIVWVVVSGTAQT